jgi:hypothetical protein
MTKSICKYFWGNFIQNSYDFLIFIFQSQNIIQRYSPISCLFKRSLYLLLLRRHIVMTTIFNNWSTLYYYIIWSQRIFIFVFIAKMEFYLLLSDIDNYFSFIACAFAHIPNSRPSYYLYIRFGLLVFFRCLSNRMLNNLFFQRNRFIISIIINYNIFILTH